MTASGQVFQPRILAFLCQWCGYAGADLAGVSRQKYPANIRVVRVMCSGRVDLCFITGAFLRGMDGVMVIGCHPGDCHYITGNCEAARMGTAARLLLEQSGVNPGRFIIDWVSASEGARFARIATDFTRQVSGLGKLGQGPGEQAARERLEAAHAVAQQPKLRYLLGRATSFVEQGNRYGEKFTEHELKRMLEGVMLDETLANRIAVASKERLPQIEEMASDLGPPLERVRREASLLQRLGTVKGPQQDRVATGSICANPRVDQALCNGCDECSRICPATVNDPVAGAAALRKAIDSATPGKGGYNILEQRPPCEGACPVHLDVRGYVGLIAGGKHMESLALIREKLPFPGIIGRICTRPCETACNRGRADARVAICALKRFVADRERNDMLPVSAGLKRPASSAATGKKVAVIGSGPAGLTCAYELALLGHGVTIFEKMPQAGGMLRAGIPAYRLPRDILDSELSAVFDGGVEIRKGAELGQDLTIDGLFQQGYQAVFLAIGAHKGLKLGIPGEDLPQVVSGIGFLHELNLGKPRPTTGTVIVIGGGNVAVDSARSALRLGASKVTILYRRTKD
ncbi:MAG: hydrogenase iron-sulfur subunit, partial [Chloroflexi bacterium]|nr:hydrogenase iron-sulfur subunit [Chloroflexota bacterium]